MQRINHDDMRRHLLACICAELRPAERDALGIGTGGKLPKVVDAVMDYLAGSVILVPDMIGRSRHRGRFGVTEPWPAGVEPEVSGPVTPQLAL